MLRSIYRRCISARAISNTRLVLHSDQPDRAGLADTVCEGRRPRQGEPGHPWAGARRTRHRRGQRARDGEARAGCSRSRCSGRTFSTRPALRSRRASYHLKFVVRENQSGNMGSFETDIQVPDLKKVPLKMSSVVWRASARRIRRRTRPSPLVRDGAGVGAERGACLPAGPAPVLSVRGL